MLSLLHNGLKILSSAVPTPSPHKCYKYAFFLFFVLKHGIPALVIEVLSHMSMNRFWAVAMFQESVQNCSKINQN
jgi:hypothetical protein